MKWVNDWIVYLEREWCQKVVYYRNKPNLPPQITMQRIIERSMWARFLTDRIRLKRMVSHSGMKIHYFTGDDIENRLVELGMMKPEQSDYKRLAAARKKVEKGGGKWRGKAILRNPSGWTSYDDMIKMGKDLKNFRPEKIGNLRTPVSGRKKPGRQP